MVYNVGRREDLLEKEISSFIKLVSRWKSSDKTPWTDTRSWHTNPNHHRLWKFQPGLKGLHLSFSPPDYWTLIFKNDVQNLLWSEKRSLDHSTTAQFLCSLAQVKCFWCCLWFRSGLMSGMWQLWLIPEGVLWVVHLEALTPASVHCWEALPSS